MSRRCKDDYVEAARARGITERAVVYRHAFRNALVPVITVIGLQVALLLCGAVLTETDLQLARDRAARCPLHQQPRLRRACRASSRSSRCRRRRQPAHRHRQRADRPAGEVLMAVTTRHGTADDRAARRRSRRAPRAGREARGHRTRRCSGSAPAITLVLRDLRDLRAADRAVRLRPVSRPTAGASRSWRHPSARPLVGTTVQSTDVLSRVDLGRPHRARGRRPRRRLLAR